MRSYTFILIPTLCINLLWGQYSGSRSFCHESGGLIINEVSNGPSGALNVKEYIEFIVIGNPGSPTSPVDLRGWIVDDNNFPGAGAGNQQGHLVFSECYSNVPPGSIIVLYNGLDRNPSIPPDDPLDSNNDGVYIIPHLDPCINACRSNPSLTDANYCPCPNITAPVGWQFGLRNSGDVAQVRDACETLVQAIHWNNVPLIDNVANTPVHFSIGRNVGSQSNKLIHFANVLSNDWNDAANYENLDINGNETPGAANNNKNADFVDQVRDGQFFCEGVISDCRDTDAGDLQIPIGLDPTPSVQILDGDTIRIEICQGENLQAFSTSYTANDEFAPDANGFNYEYAYLLTQNDRPGYTVIDFNLTGAFDFSSLDVGIYVVWGFSYVQTNGTVSISDFLMGPDAVTVEAIKAYEACGYHGDIENVEEMNIPMKVRIIESPVAMVPADLPAICGNESSLDLTQLDTIINGGSGQVVNWFSDAQTNNAITDPSTFNGDLNSVFATIGSRCVSDPISIPLTNQSNPSFALEIVRPLSCIGLDDGSIEVVFENNLGQPMIDWNVDQFDGLTVANGLTAGAYQVTVTDMNGCSDSRSITLDGVNELSLVCFASGLDASNQVIVNINGGLPPYLVSVNGRNLQVSEAGELTIEDIPAGDQTIILADANDCTVTCSISILDDGRPIISDAPSYFAPSAFSPNGDGVNASFTIFANPVEVNAIDVLRIFDRWGNLVFEREQFNPNQESLGWDGTFNGKKMNSGVFVYYAKISLASGMEELISGEVLLLN